MGDKEQAFHERDGLINLKTDFFFDPVGSDRILQSGEEWAYLSSELSPPIFLRNKAAIAI